MAYGFDDRLLNQLRVGQEVVHEYRASRTHQAGDQIDGLSPPAAIPSKCFDMIQK